MGVDANGSLTGDLPGGTVGGAVVDSCDVCDGDGTSCVVGCGGFYSM